jgi:methionine biosynthesis protein MetW
MVTTAKNNAGARGRKPARSDFRIILDHVPVGAKVLDLGCGDGELLQQLIEQKNAVARGIELEEERVIASVSRGASCVQADIDKDLAHYPTNSFDYVVLSKTLQAVHRPETAVKEMLRIGRQGIVSFPNFAYWKIRFQLMFGGRMPVTRALPEEWHETDNIHLFTIKDFEGFCRKRGIRIMKRFFLCHGRESGFHNLLPNVLAEEAIYFIESRGAEQ